MIKNYASADPNNDVADMKIIDHNMSIVSEIEVKDIAAANTKKVTHQLDLTRVESQDIIG